MNFLRNSDNKKTLCAELGLSAFACVFAFVNSIKYGVCTLLLCVLFIALHNISTYRRYRKIAELSCDIDKILHGNDILKLERYSEGELNILCSEVHKMTIRLREQQQNLTKDKQYLADSIADISHQIRTPLTSVNLLVSFLSEKNISYERRLKLSNELNELLSRIDWLISALLKISKLDTGTVNFQRENISLEALINKAVEPLLIPIELRGQNLDITANGNFCGDISWTCEAIVNIVKNCMEHTADNGSGALHIEATENPVFSEIIIKDNGSGIDKDDLPHIFERFYKGKNSSEQSVGIGLALSRMIINAQNGTIKAENGRAYGAEFIIKFYKFTI